MILILVVLAVVVFAAQKSSDVPPNPAAVLPPSRAYDVTAFTVDGLELQKTAVDPAADQKAMWGRIHNRGTAARATKPAERQGNNLDYVASGEIVPYIERLDD